MNDKYLGRMRAAAKKVKAVMADKGFDLEFGGAGPEPTRKPRAPTDARSEFLANRALGDWAEQSLACAIREGEPAWSVAHYGQSDAISAGDDGFREFYIGQLEQVRLYGKRPDLLIYESNTALSGHAGFDISMLAFTELDAYAKKAIASIEVRSSKFEALRYMEVRRLNRAAGKSNSSTRDTPSFTVKTEDLVIVYRWIERYKIPQSYVQVFFDSVWGMNFVDIFEWIGQGSFKIDNPDKSQGKATILIPITQGVQLGVFSDIPQQMLHPKVSPLGRHDTYIQPIHVPGNLKLDMAQLKKVVLG